ncbi:type II CAAX endopeptidase family protein [Klenkia sp. LSe6-5]|uniref:Type II CAAX endopeptidase family protein n=1 Tax=Klenkia sesuvii TaxID=3103137 RepID=A0ABU8DWF5_9ACTN
MPPFDEPRPYAWLMRARDWVWWRPLLGLLLFTVLYAVAAVVVVVAVAFTGVVPVADLLELTDPGVLLMTNLSLIVAIPIVWAAWAVAHGLGRGWSSSVTGKLRRRLLVPLTWRALATVGVGVVVTIGISLTDGPVRLTGPDGSYVWLLLVVLLTTPLQSAAEEFVFRGYLSQTVAAWFRTERTGAVVAAVLTAALFSAAHAPPDVLTFLDRFVFGLAASWVTRLTGGLEAAIVLHAVNNVVVFVLAGALGGDVATTTPVLGIQWFVTLLDVLVMGLYVAVVAHARRRLRPELVSPAVDLRRPVGPPVSAPSSAPTQALTHAPTWAPTWVPAPPLPPVTARPAPPEPDARWSREGGA